MQILQQVKEEYRRSPVVTIFMAIVVTMAILDFIKPASTSSILTYLGITSINLITISAILVVIWWVYWRKPSFE